MKLLDNSVVQQLLILTVIDGKYALEIKCKFNNHRRYILGLNTCSVSMFLMALWYIKCIKSS